MHIEPTKNQTKWKKYGIEDAVSWFKAMSFRFHELGEKCNKLVQLCAR